MRTRVAPTPSGFLHVGNAVNALLVSWLAGGDGTVILRIDDSDAIRYRPEYAQDILDLLRWLEIRVDEGPTTIGELETSFTQRHRLDRYRACAMTLLEQQEAYACRCPRTAPECRCRNLEIAWSPGNSAIRLVEPDRVLGTVLWRRDDQPAYHLTSVVDDHDFEITHVVRGEDLRPSTDIQRDLSRRLGMNFPQDVRHHPLVVDENGRKLSKSTSTAGPLERSTSLREQIRSCATRMAPLIDVTPRPVADDSLA